MEQTIVNATQEFFTKQIALKDERIQQLEAHIQKVTQRSYGEAAERDRMRNEMQEWTLDQLNDSEISQSQAEDIANICGFDLTKEFELEVTVQYSVTVNARDEESAQNLIHDIDFDSVSYPDGVEYLSATVDRIDI
jgi:restriction endonuclease S subunit